MSTTPPATSERKKDTSAVETRWERTKVNGSAPPTHGTGSTDGGANPRPSVRGGTRGQPSTAMIGANRSMEASCSARVSPGNPTVTQWTPI